MLSRFGIIIGIKPYNASSNSKKENNTVTKKILALILSVLMCSSLLLACTSGKDKASESSHSAVNTDEIDATTFKVDSYIESLAEQNDLDGATFSYVGGGGQTATDEEETGNIENDALYKRQRELEEAFGITWDSVKAEFSQGEGGGGHAVVELVKQAVMADQKVYDLVYGTLVVSIQPLFNEDMLEDVSGFTVTDLSAEWWPSTLRDTHAIGGKMFFLTGPIITNYYFDGASVLMNKAVADNYNIELPYEKVKEGRWTFDEMFALANAIPYGTAGTTTVRFGDPQGLSFMFASGMTITKFDDDGKPYIEPNLPVELVDLCNRFSVIMGDEKQTASEKFTASTWESKEEKYGYKSFEDMFADGMFLFYFSPTAAAAALREKDVEFGILPMPKNSADQKQYYSYADNWDARFCAVPRCTRDIATTDVVIEAMAALSLKHIRPAFYDKLLKGRSTHDTDSREMLDIIFSTKIYDIIDIYCIGNDSYSGPFVRNLEKALQFDSSTLASDYKVYSMTTNKQADKIMAMINR